MTNPNQPHEDWVTLTQQGRYAEARAAFQDLEQYVESWPSDLPPDFNASVVHKDG